MFKTILPAMFLTVAALVAAPPASANAAEYATGDVNLRAGPSLRYPSVGIVPSGAYLDVRGCVRGYRWCDVRVGGRRGWMSAAYIDTERAGEKVLLPVYVRTVRTAEIPTVSFNITTYWASYYRDYDFYRDIDTWEDIDWVHDGAPPGWHDEWSDDSCLDDDPETCLQ